MNGIRLHYLHFAGAGPSVLIVPGIVSPAILWRHAGQWLSEEFDCHILDARGRGLSESGPHVDYSVRACARDVASFIEAAGLEKPIVVGHSMGARIALRAATLSPGLIGALVLVDPPTSGPGRRAYPVPKTRTLELLRAAHRGEALASIQGGPAPWPDELQQLRAEWLPTCDERAVHVTYDDFHNEDLFADLAQAKEPVSLLCAGEGGVVSEIDVAEMRQLRSDMSIVRLPGVGHQMQAENFETFKQALGGILAHHRQTIARSGN
ncbi:alpha/beta fold hydrolase [Bordetella petrii]|uniref:Alpha/beta hydrolase n=1 Tax=Bordetella petrii TaxID=94624 RepID=A0ABT7VYU2_9BORD|nr:alpha/beta hydrolase [Bordetella petrii]MDM9558078.1 alpha/beta hydrolase [Bordetella petrii]